MGPSRADWPKPLLAEVSRSDLKFPQPSSVVAHLVRDDMGYAFFGLQLALDHHQLRAKDGGALLLQHLGPDDEVADADLVLQRDEHHPGCRFRALAVRHQAGDAHARAVSRSR